MYRLLTDEDQRRLPDGAEGWITLETARYFIENYDWSSMQDDGTPVKVEPVPQPTITRGSLFLRAFNWFARFAM